MSLAGRRARRLMAKWPSLQPAPLAAVTEALALALALARAFVLVQKLVGHGVASTDALADLSPRKRGGRVRICLYPD